MRTAAEERMREIERDRLSAVSRSIERNNEARNLLLELPRLWYEARRLWENGADLVEHVARAADRVRDVLTDEEELGR